MYKALILRKSETGETQAAIENAPETMLPEGEVELDVSYSSINYKDALAITGKAPIVRQWPMVPGIDLVGRVTTSSTPQVGPGSLVVVNGHGMGEKYLGGLAQKNRIPAEWVTMLPSSLSERHAMGIGTAGYTAMLCVLALEAAQVTPDKGPIVVTGANGGVGSFAVAILSQRGYHVVASTGRKEDTEQRLRRLGAKEVIERSKISEKGKPLQSEQWAGAIDCVGGHTLANICAQMQYGGVVTACGLAQSMDFPSTVAPFILRAVSLIGIDSVYAPPKIRDQAWQCLATELDPAIIDDITTVRPLEEAIATAHALLEGKIAGRIVIQTGK